MSSRAGAFRLSRLLCGSSRLTPEIAEAYLEGYLADDWVRKTRATATQN
jgi:hypothetical protein